jgi:hypothetical protein
MKLAKAITLLLLAILLLAFLYYIIIQSTAPAWSISIADSDKNGGVGFDSSIALDSSGNPHISYIDWNNTLKYAKWDGWGWSIQIVDTNAYIHGSTSIAVDSKGDPRITYCHDKPDDPDFSFGELKYAVWTHSAWNLQTVDTPETSGIIGKQSSLALDSQGNPHVCYFEYPDKVKYATSTSSGWEITVVDSAITPYTALALDDKGNPHIIYYNNSLKYADRVGNAWNIVTVDDTTNKNDIGFGASLAVDSAGNPHISYYDSQGFLWYAHQTDSFWKFKPLTYFDTTYYDPNSRISHKNYNIAAAKTAIQLDQNDDPSICFNDGINGLKCSHITYVHNVTVWDTQTVDANDIAGAYPALALDSNGNPHISYFNGTILKYAVYQHLIESVSTLCFALGLVIAVIVIPTIVYLILKRKKVSQSLKIITRYCNDTSGNKMSKQTARKSKKLLSPQGAIVCSEHNRAQLGFNLYNSKSSFSYYAYKILLCS